MKIKITYTNAKKGADNAGFNMTLEGGRAVILELLDEARKAIETMSE